MRVVLQRVSSACVEVGEDYRRSIGPGLLALVGVSDADGPEQVAWMARKIAHLRIFADSEDKTNCDIKQVGGSLLSVSQFTLYADTRKGNRPSFGRAGEPAHAQAVWQALNRCLAEEYGLPVETGIFGAHMRVSLVNDGPFTLILDTDDVQRQPR